MITDKDKDYYSLMAQRRNGTTGQRRNVATVQQRYGVAVLWS